MVVDANAVLPLTVTDKQLEAVAGYRSKIGEFQCAIEHVELALRRARNDWNLLTRFPS